MRGSVLVFAAVAVLGSAKMAGAVCNYNIDAVNQAKDRMLDAYNRMNRADDVAGKCALLPRIIAKVEENKARGVAGCRGPRDVVDRFIAAHDHDANEYRQVYRDECSRQAIDAAGKDKRHSSRDCEGKLSISTEPRADSNCSFVVNSCGVSVYVKMEHSETRKPKEFLVGSRPQRFCTLDKNWRWDYQGYRVAN